MAKSAGRPDIETQLAALAGTRAGIDPADIVEAVESVMASLSGDGAGVNLRLYHDIEALADFIQSAKAEITAIGADEINTEFLPAAANELSAIVAATEQATHAIFEAVESIEAASEGMAPEAAESVTDAVTRIYEACSFQDITGQRISKIVKVLQDVETKVEDLLRAFGGEISARDRGPAEPAAPAPEATPAPAPASDQDLMHGPQLPANAMSQDDIDALLASFD